MTDPGFAWHDLMSTDVPRARRFLAEVFGCAVDDLSIVPFDAAAGVGSHWVPVAATDDLPRACERARAAGGTICFGPVAHAGGGMFAFVTDPQGASFALRAGGGSEAPVFYRDKLLADDLAVAGTFYRRLFGWEPSDVPGPQIAWMIKRPPIAPRSMWLPQLCVDDVAAATQRAARLGAMIAVPPRTVAGVGTFAVIADPAAGIVAAIRPEVP